MRKLNDALSQPSEDGTVREQAMLARVITSVSVIIFCLVAMSISAYAYFSCNVSSGSGVIQAAHFETTVSIIADGNVAVGTTPVNGSYQTYKAQLEPNKTYNVTVSLTSDCTAKTGFVVISANGCEEVYHTRQLGIDTYMNGGETGKVTFTIKVSDYTEVFFVSHWGTSYQYDKYQDNGTDGELYVTSGEEIKMLIGGKAFTTSLEPSDDENASSTENTTNETASQETSSASDGTEQTASAETDAPVTSSVSETPDTTSDQTENGSVG